MSGNLLIRNVEVDGRPGLDVRLVSGRVAEIGPGLPHSGDDLDGRGGALIPGLIDHHIHLFGLAALEASAKLEDAASLDAIAALLRAKAAVVAPGAWVRGVGYHEAGGPLLDRRDLDRIAPDRPVRIQHRTGGVWVLNSVALDLVLDADPPPCVERGADGGFTGRILRGDHWLRSRLKDDAPSLAPVSAALARYGVTGATDASVTNDQAQADLFARAIAAVEWRQGLMLMSGGPLQAPAGSGIRVGPVKLLLDDHALPDLDEAVATVVRAHGWGRAAAFHCVTAGELAFALAALRSAGAAPADRIEHGGVVHPAAAAEVAEMGLTVVSQPAFIAERGDRYLAEVDAADLAALWPCASLIAAGVKLAAGSDAPYATPDPWAAMAAATRRTTRGGRPLGLGERVSARTALGLFLGASDTPGGPPRRVIVGAEADLCLLDAPLDAALAQPDATNVAATLVGGEIVYQRS